MSLIQNDNSKLEENKRVEKSYRVLNYCLQKSASKIDLYIINQNSFEGQKFAFDYGLFNMVYHAGENRIEFLDTFILHGSEEAFFLSFLHELGHHAAQHWERWTERIFYWGIKLFTPFILLGLCSAPSWSSRCVWLAVCGVLAYFWRPLYFLILRNLEHKADLFAWKMLGSVYAKTAQSDLDLWNELYDKRNTKISDEEWFWSEIYPSAWLSSHPIYFPSQFFSGDQNLLEIIKTNE